MTDPKGDVIIRMVQIDGKTYLLKEDVIDLIKKFEKMSGSINAKKDFEDLRIAFEGGLF